MRLWTVWILNVARIVLVFFFFLCPSVNNFFTFGWLVRDENATEKTSLWRFESILLAWPKSIDIYFFLIKFGYYFFFFAAYDPGDSLLLSNRTVHLSRPRFSVRRVCFCTIFSLFFDSVGIGHVVMLFISVIMDIGASLMLIVENSTIDGNRKNHNNQHRLESFCCRALILIKFLCIPYTVGFFVAKYSAKFRRPFGT